MEFNGKSILIVDDEADLTELIGLEFQLLGAKITRAHSAEEALPLIIQEAPDVIISDIRMPGGDGINLMYELHQRSVYCPVVLMSGFSDLSNEDAYRIGAVAKLQKPFERRQLVEAVYRACLPVTQRWVQEVGDHDTLVLDVFVQDPNLQLNKNFVLGHGGAFVQWADALPKNDQIVRVRLTLAADETPFATISGRVRWIRKESPRLLAGFGFEFLTVPDHILPIVSQALRALKSSAYIPYPQ